MAINLSANAVGQSANITGLASVTTNLFAKIQIRVDFCRAFTNTTAGIWQVSDVAGTNPKLILYANTDNAGNIWFVLNQPGQGGIGSSANAVALSTFPANGSDIEIYTGWVTSGSHSQVCTVFDGSGTVLYNISGSSNLGSLVASGSNGAVLLNDTNPSALSVANFCGGLAFYSTALTGTNQWSAPSGSDSGIIAGWPFNDASSGTTPTSGSPLAGGQSMAWSGTYAWANDSATGAWFGGQSINLSGQLAQFSVGTLSPSTGAVSVSTTGNVAAFASLGSVTEVDISIGLAGQDAAFLVGTITPQTTSSISANVPLGGLVAGFSIGTLTGLVGPQLIGQSAQFTVGQLTVQTTNSTTISLKGTNLGFSIGTLTISIPFIPPVNPPPPPVFPTPTWIIEGCPSQDTNIMVESQCGQVTVSSLYRFNGVISFNGIHTFGAS